jgi:hypothetical protein
MKKLTEIGIKHDTDKATGHMFTEFYEDYVSKYKNPNLLEIGIHKGGSLKMWEEYFGSPFIVAIDIEEKTQYETANIKTIKADQGNPSELLKCLDLCKEYQVIVDDGSHLIGHQISALAHLFPHLSSGGVYFLEDLHTSFAGPSFNPANDMVTAYDFLYRLGRSMEIETPYASSEQINYLIENIADIKIFRLNENVYYNSMTSAILKK